MIAASVATNAQIGLTSRRAIAKKQAMKARKRTKSGIRRLNMSSPRTAKTPAFRKVRSPV